MLPILWHKDKYDFLDERMRQLGNVEDFNDSINFDKAGARFSFRMNECQQIT